MEDLHQLVELVRALGEDGEEYVVRPAEFSLPDLENLWKRFSAYNVGMDDVADWDSFLRYIRAAEPVWFEGVKAETGAQVGLIYLDNFLPMWVGGPGYVQAQFHAVAWDHDASNRLPVLKAAVKRLFELFRLHRMEARVPTSRGGAIRVLKRLGFQEEGRLREVRRHHNEWWDIVILSLLDHEVNNGARAE